MESSTIMASRATTSSVFSFCSNPNSKSTHVKFLAQKPPIPFFETHKCIQSLKPNTQNLSSRFACSAATLSPSSTTELVPFKLHRLIEEFESISEPVDRVKRLLRYASLLPPYGARNDSNRVMGCTAQVWLEVRIDQEGKMRFAADSDSEISKGFCSCLISVLDGALPEDVLRLKTEDLVALNVGLPVRERSRVNTWYNVLISMQKRTKGLIAELEGKLPFEAFPSLVVSADGIHAKGSYAEAQARYLFPNDSTVKELVKVLKEKKIGVVAHFYMDPEVQGVLTAARKEWPHIYISDSLVMADMAVKMAKDGCQFVTVLGVDFMSENVRAILDQAGFGEVGVYRMSDEQISCSLADAAATPSYMNYLEMASREAPSLHVIYINTSLETKAYAHELVPTITCTSSNVMQTILQAFAQVPELNVWYGPDSYMGANIVELLQQMTKMTDDEIAKIHPNHSRDSIRSLLPRLHYYQEGTCIVHHLFGHEVVEKINEMYCDAFLTAHFEVPGEMFALAMEAKRRGMGIVGSTQNILDFIIQRVQEALDRNVNEHLQFVLGTESGMITSIVAAVRNLLSSSKTTSGGAKINVEIVFPVSSDSVTSTSSSSSPGRKSVALGEINLPVVPGVSSGEGCSIHGGCASCPYMKDSHVNYNMASANGIGRIQGKQPLFSFGVIADVQYADIPDGRSFLGTPRYYRHSILVLKRAVQSWNNQQRLKFVLNFGDIVDGFCPKDQSLNSIKKVVSEFDNFNGQVYHMIGNHCLYNLPRKELVPLLKIPRLEGGHAYYDFSPTPDFRFVVLDGYDISAIGWPKGHPNSVEALKILSQKNPNADKNSPSGLTGLERRYLMFNGGVGKEQLKWLDSILQEATNLKQKVIVCCHLPLDPGATSFAALLWNYDEVMDLIHSYNCVKVCLAGHNHKGGYAIDSHGIHHRVLEAALECPPGTDAFGYIDVFSDGLYLTATDRMSSSKMLFDSACDCENGYITTSTL